MIGKTFRMTVQYHGKVVGNEFVIANITSNDEEVFIESESDTTPFLCQVVSISEWQKLRKGTKIVKHIFGVEITIEIL